MPDRLVTFNHFGGLELRGGSTATGASDMLNVEVDRPVLRTRGGLTRLGTGTATYHKIAPLSSTQLVAVRNNGSGLVFQAVTISSGAFGSATTAYGGATTLATSVAEFGTGALDGILIGVCSRTGATNENLRTWDGTAAVTNKGYAPRYANVSPVDGSIMLAHFSSPTATPSGGNGSQSTVWFGAVNDPFGFTFGSTDWLQLDPNDGDEIVGTAVWRESDVVVKRRAMYWHSTNTITATGARQFNFRRVELPSRTRATAARGGECIVAAGDAVYLLLGDGIYRSTGGVPVRVSDPVTPLFDGTGPTASLFPASGDWTFGAANNRVYLSYQVGSAFRTLVYDTLLGTWMLWDVSVATSAQPTSVIEWYDTNGLSTAYVAAGAKIFSFTRTGTTDDGTAITWSYTRCKYQLAEGDRTAISRETSLFGTGTVTVTLSTDATADQSGSVTLGTAPTPAVGWLQKDQEGVYWSHTLSGSGQATVEALTHHLDEVKDAGVV